MAPLDLISQVHLPSIGNMLRKYLKRFYIFQFFVTLSDEIKFGELKVKILSETFKPNNPTLYNYYVPVKSNILCLLSKHTVATLLSNW